MAAVRFSKQCDPSTSISKANSTIQELRRYLFGTEFLAEFAPELFL